MEHRAGSHAHPHPGVAATDRRADARSGTSGHPAALVDTDAYTDGAYASPDTQIHAAAADTDTQLHTR